MKTELVQRKLCTVKCVHNKADKLNNLLCKCEILQRRVNKLQSFHFISKQFSMSQRGANKQRLADSLQRW